MSPDDWKVIERIFHNALDRPRSERGSFVECECSDPHIRAEVMNLLSRVSEDDGLSRPAFVRARELIATAQHCDESPDSTALGLVGVTLSHFTIEAYLGKGGMGVVYRANDTKLQRKVALKVLPERTSTEPTYSDRLVREARAASALNHPNIVTIYETGSDHGTHFIAMELISGETLAEIVRSGLSVRQVLQYAIQIADALACAHDASVVHRDLKPSNIMVTERGQVKVLDFGLAKTAMPVPVSDAATRTISAGITQEGVIVGTVAYMSPEQAQGNPVDARSDIFSFGAVLYEMFTGERAFARDSPASTLSAILREEPPPLGAHVPASVQAIVWRCLRKNTCERWQTLRELRTALNAVNEDGTWGGPQLRSHTKTPKRTHSWLMAATFALVICVAAGALLWKMRAGQARSELVPVRLTSNPVESPIVGLQLSPDGRYLSYSDTNGVHLRSVENGDSRLLAGTKGMFVPFIGWSSDGTRLFIGQHGDSQPSFFSIPMFGGVPQPMGNELPLALSGFSLTISVAGVQLKAEDGSAYPTHERGAIHGIAANRKLVAVAFTHANRSYSIQAFDIQKRQWTVLLPAQPEEISGLAWISGYRLLYAQAEPWPRRRESNLWVLPIDPEKRIASAAPKRRTQWVDFDIAGLSATADGQRVSLLRGKEEDRIFIAALLLGGNKFAEPRRLSTEAANEQIWAWTPDSKAVIYTSDRNGQDQLFRHEVDRDSAELIASGKGVFDFGQVSPDTRSLLFLSHERKQDNTESRVMRMPLGGGRAQEVSTGPDLDSLQCSSAAGGSCIISQTRGLTSRVYLFDVVRGWGPLVIETKLDAGGLFGLDHGSSRGSISPNGSHIALVLPGAQHNLIRIVGLNGVPEADITVRGAGNLTSIQWSPDGAGFFCGDVSSDGSSRLLHVHRDGTSAVLWTNPGDTQMWAIPSPDGRYLGITIVAGSANVWVVEKP